MPDTPPSADAMNPAALLTEMTRRFTEMRFPSMIPDSSALMAAHRRNMDVLSNANRLALEGAQAVARRHMEIMQQTMTELSEHVRELSASESPQAKAARQAELVKKSYERAVANIKDLSELIPALQYRGAARAERAVPRGDGRDKGPARQGRAEPFLTARPTLPRLPRRPAATR